MRPFRSGQPSKVGETEQLLPESPLASRTATDEAEPAELREGPRKRSTRRRRRPRPSPHAAGGHGAGRGAEASSTRANPAGCYPRCSQSNCDVPTAAPVAAVGPATRYELLALKTKRRRPRPDRRSARAPLPEDLLECAAGDGAR